MQLEVPPPSDRVLRVGVSREGGDCSRLFWVGREQGWSGEAHPLRVPGSGPPGRRRSQGRGRQVSQGRAWLGTKQER